MRIETKYGLGESVIAPDKMKPGAPSAAFTVEAIRLDHSGIHYLICLEPQPYPDHQTRCWMQEREIKSQAKAGRSHA